MIVKFKTQDVSLYEEVSNLSLQLNKRIAHLAKLKLDSQRFGAKNKIDENQYFILVKYSEILKLKAHGSICLREYSFESIISVIKQYLTTGKVVNFKKTNMSALIPFVGDLGNGGGASSGTQESSGVQVVYNYFNKNTYFETLVNTTEQIVKNIINNITNTGVHTTEIVEDTWETTEW